MRMTGRDVSKPARALDERPGADCLHTRETIAHSEARRSRSASRSQRSSSMSPTSASTPSAEARWSSSKEGPGRGPARARGARLRASVAATHQRRWPLTEGVTSPLPIRHASIRDRHARAVRPAQREPEGDRVTHRRAGRSMPCSDVHCRRDKGRRAGGVNDRIASAGCSEDFRQRRSIFARGWVDRDRPSGVAFGAGRVQPRARDAAPGRARRSGHPGTRRARFRRPRATRRDRRGVPRERRSGTWVAARSL